MFESSLRAEGQRRLADIGTADIVIGIPTYKNARTLAPVMRAAAEGLAQHLQGLRGAIAIVDGGSPDETIAVAQQVPLPPQVRRVVTSYQGIQGKGSAVRATFEMARTLHARIVLILEADLQSITPEWIVQLVRPILAREYELVVPHYVRPLPDGAMTDLLAYPLTRMLYGVDVRQPMGGEFAVSAELAQRLVAKDVWETDIARHGIDIWLTTVAINEGVKLCQVRLGVKLDDSREMLLAFDPTFVQAVGTLFRLMDIYRRRWVENGTPKLLPFFGNGNVPSSVRDPLPNVSAAALSDAFAAGARRYARLWKSALAPSTRAAIKELSERPNGAWQFTSDLWTRTVFDFAVVYNQGEGDPDKVVAALLPLYYARCATIMRETGLEPAAVERAVRSQADSFVGERGYLLRMWNTYVPWAWEGVR